MSTKLQHNNIVTQSLWNW